MFCLNTKRQANVESVNEAELHIRSILDNKGYKDLADEAAEVEDIHYYYEIVSIVLSDEEIRVFIDYLLKNNQMWHLRVLINSIQSDRLIQVLRSEKDMINILCKHVCDRTLMKYVNSLPKEKKNEFWSRTECVDDSEFSKTDFSKVIKLLLINKNYILTIRLLESRIHRAEVDNDLVIKVLDECVIPENEHSSTYEEMKYPIYSIVDCLQKKEDIPYETMVRIEAKYIDFLCIGDEINAPNVFCRMANDPKYVENILLERRQQIKHGIYDSSVNTLFRYFRLTPGTQKDSSFDYASYCNWYDYAVKEADSDVRSDMIELFGRASAHVGKDEDGFFINRKVAEFLERSEGYGLITMFEIELFDSIGPITISDDLSEPRRIIKAINEKAEMCEAEGYLKVADSFRSVSFSLETHFEL